ncbi:hypothetical protein PT974_10599 [Cladobotryum mycophilum]|uniref:Uncharacterized protein n=1 Tax=Cladobotryum mycophilum TaxID=491253 RepID=A0ABR0SB72_9HYPO
MIFGSCTFSGSFIAWKTLDRARGLIDIVFCEARPAGRHALSARFVSKFDDTDYSPSAFFILNAQAWWCYLFSGFQISAKRSEDSRPPLQ